MKKESMSKIIKVNHPIETGRYVLPTNEIFKLSNIIVNWIDNRIPGAIVYGNQRLGKSNAIIYMKKLLKEHYGYDFPVFSMKCERQRRPSVDNFFSVFLKNIGHSLYLNGRSQLKRDRLTKYLLEKGLESNLKKIVIIFDEAQKLSFYNYEWLMEIYNELYDLGITMISIFVGQKELLQRKSAFIHARKMQIIGRFMIHEHKFRGLMTVDDIKQCLLGYDEICEFPTNSGISFTKYYFPEAFKDGHRLVELSDTILKLFEMEKIDAKISFTEDIAMQYFTLTIEYLIKHYGINEDCKYWLSKKDCKIALGESGYAKSESINIE
jgi:hypothetical protein